MTINDLKKLHSGDEITWNDPDDGICSRTEAIQSLDFKGDGVVGIHWLDGGYTEALTSEIS